MVRPDALTPAARVALILADFQEGAMVPAGTSGYVLIELISYELITARFRLTRAGAVVRARCFDEMQAHVEQSFQ